MRNQLVAIFANDGRTFFQVFEWLPSFVFKRQLCKCYPIIVPSIYPICIIIPIIIPNMIPTIIFVYTNLYHVSVSFPHHFSHHVNLSLCHQESATATGAQLLNPPFVSLDGKNGLLNGC